MGAKIPSWNGRFIPLKKNTNLVLSPFCFISEASSFLLEKFSAKFASKLIGKVDSVLRAERIENFICELVGFDVHISRVPIQVAAHANAFAVSQIVHEHQHERKFVAHPLLHKLPLLFHVSWKHQWFSIYVWRDLCAANKHKFVNEK